MIRVAWMVPNSPNWMGGLNYFRNLLEALLMLPDRQIEPVIIGHAASLPPPLDRCPSVPIAQPRLLTPAGIRDYVGRKWLLNGGNLASTLASGDVELFSHALLFWFGRRSPVPVLCWLPDFQHLHLPHLFTPAELAERQSKFAAVALHAQAVVVSSEDARQDFASVHPEAARRAYVLRFVAHAPPLEGLPPAETVLARHGLDEAFFHIPNQLWAHKNHALVVQALSIVASRRGRAPLVISTGQMEDYRNPDHFPRFIELLAQAGLADRFRVLGLLPYAEVAVLMRQAIAMINPSLFEGWSTTVEEAKSLGKRLLLSDIPVHREQAPARGTYFNPADPEALAQQMAAVLDEHDASVEQTAAAAAAAELPGRMQAYGRAYERIVLDVLRRRTADGGQ